MNTYWNVLFYLSIGWRQKKVCLKILSVPHMYPISCLTISAPSTLHTELRANEIDATCLLSSTLSNETKLTTFVCFVAVLKIIVVSGKCDWIWSGAIKFFRFFFALDGKSHETTKQFKKVSKLYSKLGNHKPCIQFIFFHIERFIIFGWFFFKNHLFCSQISKK